MFYFICFFVLFFLIAYLLGLAPSIYIKRCFISIDQLINTLCFGYEDETLSSRAFRWSNDGGHIRKIPAIIINILFFWDYAHDINKHKIRHCELSFISERKRLQQPPELRPKVYKPIEAGEAVRSGKL